MTREERSLTHKLGYVPTRDLATLKARASHDMDRVRGKVLARMELLLDKYASKITFQQLAITYGILTDKQLILESGPAQTTNNTIVINGLSRDQALGLLRGDTGRDGFLPPSRPNMQVSAYNDMSPDLVQNSPVLVDNSPPLQR